MMELDDLPLTPRQKELLREHLWFYDELFSGKRKLTTADQAHFVHVCNGKSKPRTEHEAAYLAYQEACGKQSPKREVNQRSRVREIIQQNLKQEKLKQAQKQKASQQQQLNKQRPLHEIDPRAPKPWARYIDEPLGSREDFKRDGGRNWSRAIRPK